MRGDRVEVVVDTGQGTTVYEITATRAGRRVEVSTGRGGVLEVTEVTRSGQPVRMGRFMASRVVAVVEHPADGSHPSSGDGRSRRRTRASDSAQGRLL